METLRSADGTAIAYERAGDGPPVILIGGAFNDRTTVAAAAEALSPTFTTYVYDRRGRGDSGGGGDGPDTAVDREIEDLAALVGVAGGAAHLFGHSSGGKLALEAAARGLPVARLAVYEAPYLVDDSRPRPAADLADRVRERLAAGDRTGAVTLFLTEAVGVPPAAVEQMQGAPMWPGMTALAHTLPDDLALNEPGVALPAAKLARVAVPTLAIDGGDSPPWMRAGVRAVADAVPGATYVTIEGQDHGILHHPEALAPTLVDFLG